MGLALQMRPSLPRIRDGARSAALPCRVLAKVNRADESAKHKVWNSISFQSTVPIIITIVNPLATTRGCGGGAEISVEPKRPAKEAGGGHLEVGGGGESPRQQPIQLSPGGRGGATADPRASLLSPAPRACTRAAPLFPACIPSVAAAPSSPDMSSCATPAAVKVRLVVLAAAILPDLFALSPVRETAPLGRAPSWCAPAAAGRVCGC